MLAARSRLATLVWLVAFVLALVLAVAALLVALRADRDDELVRLVLDTAGRVDLGTVHVFSGPDALLRDHLVSWGAVAVEYLVVGKILDRVIRPRPAPGPAVPAKATRG